MMGKVSTNMGTSAAVAATLMKLLYCNTLSGVCSSHLKLVLETDCNCDCDCDYNSNLLSLLLSLSQSQSVSSTSIRCELHTPVSVTVQQTPQCCHHCCRGWFPCSWMSPLSPLYLCLLYLSVLCLLNVIRNNTALNSIDSSMWTFHYQWGPNEDQIWKKVRMRTLPHDADQNL